MTSAGEERLPASIGGLIDLACSGYAQRAPLYLGLAALVFVLSGAVDALSALSAKSADVEALNVSLCSLFADAFVVAAVALGIGTRVAGETPPAGALVGGSVLRWMPVLGTMAVVQLVFAFTAASGGLGASDPADLVFAPLVWLLWGALSLAGPVAALAAERGPLAVAVALLRALSLGLRGHNLGRLCVVAFASVVPLLLEEVVGDLLLRRHVPHALFWANLPIDALVVGPLAALQTVFALDFARRVEALSRR